MTGDGIPRQAQGATIADVARGMAGAPASDGRRERKVMSRIFLLAGCRHLMKEGCFRPNMVEICAQAGRSVRTGFDCFPTVEALHVAAISDGETRASVLGRLVDNTDMLEDAELDNIIRAIITGR